ncbi:MAG: hypothetical protein FWC11_00805 [Firmicutes bacterium]|nr:hypothetical protein [Bacillota bacterium]
MKKRLVIIILSLAVVFASLGIFTGCENGDNETNHRVSWSAEVGLTVLADSNNSEFVSGGNIASGGDIRFSWFGVQSGYQLEIYEGATRIHFFAGDGHFYLRDVRANRNLDFSVGEIVHVPDCDVCLDSGEHCRNCCDDEDCQTCTAARINIIFMGARAGVESWGIYDANGNALNFSNIPSGHQFQVRAGDILTLRWNSDIEGWGMFMRIGGDVILRTNTDGQIEEMDPRLTRDGDNWEIEIEVLRAHSLSPLVILMNITDL